jgi:hypothetical protein
MAKVTAQQALRRKPIPPALKRLLALVNSIPPDVAPPLPADTIGEWVDSEEWKGKPDSTIFDGMVEHYKRAVGRLPASVRRFIGPVTSDTLDQAQERHSFVLDGRRVLREIARADKSKRVLEIDSSQLALLRLELGPNSRISLVHTRLLQALEGVEANRIKQCPNCWKIFWAGRIDQPGCSQRCTGNIRIKRWREAYPEKYKLQRYNKGETDSRRKES